MTNVITTCQECGNEFLGYTRQQRWCLNCVPDYDNRVLMKLYGLNMVKCEAMLKDQNHACALCLRKFAEIKYDKRKKRPWVVDHCHKTGIVRGLLCLSCNQLLGYVEARGGQAWAGRSILYLDRSKLR